MIRRSLCSSSPFLRLHPVHIVPPRLIQERSSSPFSTFKVLSQRSYVTKSTADEKIEDLQGLYATARDEFELASEETEKKTIYAADDRAAAHEELAKLKAAFEEAIKGDGGEEIKNRIGQRVRELDNAAAAMDEMAKED